MPVHTSGPGAGRPPGEPGLGPHVVGRRVVVRRVLRGERGPSGGPALTDVLGVCTSWGEGVCVVQPDSGPAVVIALADVVSGKPIPPRPVPRMRVSPREAQGHALAMWPHVETVELGEWVLRTDPAPVGRPLKRANSCLAMGDPDVTLVAAVARVGAFYAERDRPALAQVVTGSAAEDAFAAAGWYVVPGADSLFLLTSVAGALRRQRTPAAGVDPVLIQVDGPRARAWVPGRAEARAALDDSPTGAWLGVYAFVVDPAHRRRGLASALLVTLLDWGAERRATTAWLHVEVANGPARELYARFGFAEHHAYRYLAAP